VETGDEARDRKIALNQSTFRDANERIERAAQSHRFEESQRVPFLCECADPGCTESVMLTLADYEAVRAHADRFFLIAGHEAAGETRERILEAADGYSVVEKIGIAGAESERLDPRAQRAPSREA
jgi:hypothetical protein